jgi:hypothetical protein
MTRSFATMTMAVCAAMLPVPVLAQGATDNAGNPAYATEWTAGSNGGTGFGPWSFAFSGDLSLLVHPTPANPSPQFIDFAPPLTGNSLSSPAFALTTSDRPFFGDTSEVNRMFNVPLAVGDTFQVDVNGSALSATAPPFTIGNTLQLIGANGMERWGMFTNNGYLGNNWVATGDANTGIPAGNAFRVAFTLTGPDSYDLVITPVGGGAPLYSQTFGALTGTSGVGITSIRISAYGTGSTADGNAELFFNNLLVFRGAPRVGSITVNDGSAQRSRVTSLRVAFNQIVNFSGTPESAFELKRQSDNALVTLGAAVDNTGPGTVVTLTFTGGPVESASLADGRYTLTIDATQVSNANGQLDGDGNGTPGGNFVLASSGTAGVFRLFGDSDGNATVNAVDFAAFREAFGTNNAAFDFDNNGSVSAADFVAFRQRFGMTLP